MNHPFLIKKSNFNYLLCFVLFIFLSASLLAEAKMPLIQLPKPHIDQRVALNTAIQNRRSIRVFKSTDLSLDQISALLWAGQGITDSEAHFRVAPSAGALYPLELYVVKHDGLWHYLVKNHQLELVSEKNLKSDLAKAAMGQESIEQASVDIIVTAVYQRTTYKYGDRGKRYVHMEAGHVMQNILLEAVSLKLGAVPIGAFSDNAVRDLLKIPQDQVPLYILPIGYARK